MITQEICVGSIHENCFDSVVAYITGICFLQPEQIVVLNRLLIGAVSLTDIFLELRNRSMQVDQEVGLNQLLVNYIKQFLI